MNTPSPAASITYSGQCSRTSAAALLKQLGDDAGPARLVARADAPTRVAVKVFVEQHEVAPMRIGVEHVGVAVHRTTALAVAQEDTGDAPRELGRNLAERHEVARAGRVLHLDVAAKEVVKALQRLDEQEIHREPDGPAPVGVAAEESRGRLRRLVVDAIRLPVHLEHVGMPLVELR